MFKENDLLLDRTSKFKQQFIEDLRHGKFLPGDVIPPRHVLAETYNISGSTVARIVGELTRDKILATRKGRFGGTYLLNKPKLPGEIKNLRFHFSNSPEKKVRAGYLRRWLDHFVRDNPDYKAEIIPQVFHFQQMETMSPEFVKLHEYELPSILLVPLSSMQGLAARKLIRPLIAEPAEAARETQIFLPEIRSALLVDGAMYGYLTENISTNMIIYSRERLERCAVSVEELSGDWSSWLKTMAKLNEVNGGLLLENGGLGVFLLFVHLLKEFLGPNWIRTLSDWNGIMPSQECFAALEELQNLEKTVGLIAEEQSNQWQTLSRLAANGPAALMTVSSIAKNYFSFVRDPEELVMAPLPSRTANIPNLIGNAMTWVLTNDKEREAALTFLRWAVTPENWMEIWLTGKSRGNEFQIPPFADNKKLPEQVNGATASWTRFQQRISGATLVLEPPASIDFKLSVGRLLLDWLKSGRTVHDGQERLCGLWASWLDR